MSGFNMVGGLDVLVEVNVIFVFILLDKFLIGSYWVFGVKIKNKFYVIV